MGNKKSTLSKEKVERSLKNVMDPELGVNIVDLGLVYGIDIEGGTVNVRMTLTFPGCPLVHQIIEDAKQRVESIPGVKKANIELVWDPPWTSDRVKKEIKDKLGL